MWVRYDSAFFQTEIIHTTRFKGTQVQSDRYIGSLFRVDVPVPEILQNIRHMVTAMQDICLSCYMRFFMEIASFFKKKPYLCTEMSDKREYWTSMRWRCLQSKGILSR